MATQVKVRLPGNSLCPYHSDKDVIYICEDCPAGTLVCSECVTTRHRTHRLEKLSNTIPWKKEQVLRYIDATETHKLPSIQKDIDTLDIKLLENKTTFHDLILDIETHADLWKASIDTYVDKNVQIFLELEKENTEVLLKHKRELLNESSDIKEMLGNHRSILQDGNHVHIFDIKTGHHVQSTFPHTKKAKFKRRDFSMECLPHVFGSVGIENVISQEKPVTETNERVGSSFLKPQQAPKLVRRNSTGRIRETAMTKKSEPKPQRLKVEQDSKHVRRNSEHFIKSVKKSELKPTTKKITNTRRHSALISINIDNTDNMKQSSKVSDTKENQGHFESPGKNCGYTLVSPVQLVMFDAPYGSVDFISPTKDDLAWVCKYNDTSVRLVDLMGDTQEEVDCPSSITGVSVAPDTGHLWVSCLDRGIREIVPQDSKSPPLRSHRENNIKFIPSNPKLMQRRKSADSSGREKMTQNSKILQRQKSVDFSNNPEFLEGSNKYLRKNSFDSSCSDRASQQHKVGLNDQRTNSKRRKAISKSLNEVEARLAGLGKSVDLNSRSDEYLHIENKTPVLPSINIIPPDSNSSVICIFNNNDEVPPHKQKMETPVKQFLLHSEQKQTNPQYSNGQHMERHLREVKRRAIVRFYVEDTPWSLCITKNNTVLTGMANTIVVHSTWGQVLHQVKKQSWFTYSSPPVTSLQQMVQCPVSCNIAVMGRSQLGPQHVFILDSELNLISYYAGDKDSSDKMAAISTLPFSATALCYDSVGNLVVADGNNRSIVLISSTGHYLKTIHQDTWATQAVGVQEDNTLWAAFKLYNNVEVKLIRYTE